VNTITEPKDKIEAHFVKCQEKAPKDIDRAFGVLQAS
jgi:hypothetical protein